MAFTPQLPMIIGSDGILRRIKDDGSEKVPAEVLDATVGPPDVSTAVGVLAPDHGGTGLDEYSKGDLLVGGSSNLLDLIEASTGSEGWFLQFSTEFPNNVGWAPLGVPPSTEDLLLTNETGGTIPNRGFAVTWSDGSGVNKGFVLAQADDVDTAFVVGILMSGPAAADSYCSVKTTGNAYNTTTDWDAVTGGSGGLTPGAHYFLDESTPGRLRTGIPAAGNYRTYVGHAQSPTVLTLRIELPIGL